MRSGSLGASWLSSHHHYHHLHHHHLQLSSGCKHLSVYWTGRHGTGPQVIRAAIAQAVHPASRLLPRDARSPPPPLQKRARRNKDKTNCRNSNQKIGIASQRRYSLQKCTTTTASRCTRTRTRTLTFTHPRRRRRRPHHPHLACNRPRLITLSIPLPLLYATSLHICSPR